jgi:hypothetical protein
LLVTQATVAAEVSVTEVGPGWHPDPTGRHAIRYWDGQRWTEQVSDPTSDPVQAASAAVTRESAGTPASFATEDRNNDWRWSPAAVVLGIVAALVLGGVVGLLLYQRHHTPTPTPAAFADSSLTTPSVVSDSPPTTTPWFPPGYYQGTGSSSDFAYKFSLPSNFQCHGTNYLSTPVPCWQLVVISRLACPGGVSVDLNIETTGHTIIGQATGLTTVDLAPGDRAIVQVQGTQSVPPGVTGGPPDITCL